LKFNKDQISKILIIKPSAVGDVLLSTPVIENLKHNFPNATINFLTQFYCRDIVIDNPFLSRVLTFEIPSNNGLSIPPNIKKQKYDLIIDLFCNPRTAFITFYSRAKYRVGYKHRLRSYAYNIIVPSRREIVHNVEVNLDALRALDLEIIANKPLIYLNNIYHKFADDFFEENRLVNKKIIGINPSATWITKAWLPQKFIELIKLLTENNQVLLFWGNDKEKLLAESINENVNNRAIIIPSVSLKYLAALISRCSLFVSNDTGPMQIAWTLGINTIAIFGPTKSKLHGPLNANSMIIQNNNIDCLGCNLTKIEDCRNQHKCMRDLDVKIVHEKCIELLNK
jgi:heptosyltransferase II